mmetsp:Transcript_53952/g.115886  ORF Transcript_53952/g.115886 Transcript_53952/m.115886 type:complete len:369 (+) Transcript_53952:81-1187(+)|eukprot:CAMPEP_0180576300 /NCGR_PEP_ID=MMETSP1037_2-20121125/11346_1 /TAXON_ID=632150 /ORGANISM="Azadinium spinosum, Strain 3D9" /LENGTH=368 /DNA_ID=CAMNT_0022594009 /DNA_START=23 /DNA_END=1129 /DNA_ORIENTATION=+
MAGSHDEDYQAHELNGFCAEAFRANSSFSSLCTVAEAEAASAAAANAAASAEEDLKVHQYLASAKSCRRFSVSAESMTPARMENWKFQGPPVHEKSLEDFERIKATIQQSSSSVLQVLFGHLQGHLLDPVVSAMFFRTVEVGEIIIQQGADGDFFYIVDCGVYEIFVQRMADTMPERVAVVTAGASFGELALLYNVPRAATVRCAEAGGLWCLDRESFQMMLVTAESTKNREYESFLSQISVLSSLNSYELAQLSDCLTSELFDDSEEIVRQGEPGDSIYFLYEGSCRAFINGELGEVEVKTYTQPGEYFGEIVLIQDEPRRATVRAGCGGCVVLRLKREDVDISVGNIRERLQQTVQQYPAYEVLAG